MQNYPELTQLCAHLNLRGLADTFNERHRQALADNLSHVEFLTLLMQDELAKRHQKRLATRLKQAQLRHDKTIECFDASSLHAQRSLLNELRTVQFVKEATPVLIVGPAGTGKTHLAHALGHQAIRKGFDVLALSQAQLETRLAQARAQGTRAKLIRAISRVDLLLIDDFGLKPLRAPSDEDLHEIIDERYERKATMVTSNLDVSEWQQAFASNQLIAVATVDRLRHRAYQIILEGKSRRAPKPVETPDQSPSQAAKETPPKHPKNSKSNSTKVG